MQIAGPWKSVISFAQLPSVQPALDKWCGGRAAAALHRDRGSLCMSKLARPLTEPEQTRLTGISPWRAGARRGGHHATSDEDIVRGLFARRPAAQRHPNIEPASRRAPAAVNSCARSLLQRWMRGERRHWTFSIVRADKTDTTAAPDLAAPGGSQPGANMDGLGRGGRRRPHQCHADSVLGYRTIALNFLLAVVGLALFVGARPSGSGGHSERAGLKLFLPPPRFTFFIRTLKMR